MQRKRMAPQITSLAQKLQKKSDSIWREKYETQENRNTEYLRTSDSIWRLQVQYGAYSPKHCQFALYWLHFSFYPPQIWNKQPFTRPLSFLWKNNFKTSSENISGAAVTQSCKNVQTVQTSRCYFFWPVLIFGKSTRKTVLFCVFFVYFLVLIFLGGKLVGASFYAFCNYGRFEK